MCGGIVYGAVAEIQGYPYYARLLPSRLLFRIWPITRSIRPPSSPRTLPLVVVFFAASRVPTVLITSEHTSHSIFPKTLKGRLSSRSFQRHQHHRTLSLAHRVMTISSFELSPLSPSKWRRERMRGRGTTSYEIMACPPMSS